MGQHNGQGRPQGNLRKNNCLSFWSWVGFLLCLALLLLVTYGCNSPLNPFNESVEYVLYENSDNCTVAEVYKPDEKYVFTINKNSAKKETISSSVIKQQDKTLRFFQTPQSQVEAILAGTRGVIPPGCDDWGFDVATIYMRGGIDTDDLEIRLQPPDYWEDESRWKADHPDLSAETVDRAKVQFQNSLK